MNTTEISSSYINELVDDCDFVKSFGELDETGTWGIECDEVPIVVTWNPEERMLTLQASLGQPLAANRQTAYQVLLAITGQSRLIRGIRMGVDEPDGNVYQECDVAVDRVDMVMMKEHFEYFYRKATAAKHIVERTEPHAETDAPRPAT